MKYKLISSLPTELTDQFQIFVSRVEEELDEAKIRLYWLQDLPGDPASEHLKNGGWKKFHKIVFNTNWQAQAYMGHYGIPWSKCVVLLNAIEPIKAHKKPKDIIRLGYWSTPHRGLNILVPVFQKLCEKYDNIELDVFSSFKLYGWEPRDQEFEQLFKQCEQHPKINYHGAVANDKLRKHMEKIHIFAYPSIWTETSCISLMEAMSAKMVCVHPNFGALYETAACWTTMYQWNEDINEHAALFYHILGSTIENINEPTLQDKLDSQKAYVDVFYNWEGRALQWEALLTSLLNEPREIPKTSGEMFSYHVN